MPRRSDEEDDAAAPEPGFSTQTNADCNDGASHAEPDAEGTEADPDADVEKEFESTGKKHNYAGPHSYRLIKKWATGPHAVLEDAGIHLWKQYSKEYHDKRTDEWTRPFRCVMHYRCGCQAQVKLITEPDYKRLEFFGTHDAQSHANERSKKLTHEQIILIHDAGVIAPN